MATDFVGTTVTGLNETLNYFKLLAEDKFPAVQRNACNDLGFLIRDAEMEEMRTVFDRPKEQTIRNIRVLKAGNAKTGAFRTTTVISFNQIYEGDEYMVPEVKGGERSMKRSEKAFGHYYVPGIGARLDQYGNIVPGQITQILSCLQLMKETGYTANRRDRAHKSGTDYFLLTKKTNGLVPGVYLRVDKSQGQMLVARALANKPKGMKRHEVKAQYAKALNRGVVPVIIFVSRPPEYKPRFRFFEVADRVTDQNYARLMGEWADRVLKPGGR